MKGHRKGDLMDKTLMLRNASLVYYHKIEIARSQGSRILAAKFLRAQTSHLNLLRLSQDMSQNTIAHRGSSCRDDNLKMLFPKLRELGCGHGKMNIQFYLKVF